MENPKVIIKIQNKTKKVLSVILQQQIMNVSFNSSILFFDSFPIYSDGFFQKIFVYKPFKSNTKDKNSFD